LLLLAADLRPGVLLERGALGQAWPQAARDVLGHHATGILDIDRPPAGTRGAGCAGAGLRIRCHSNLPASKGWSAGAAGEPRPRGARIVLPSVRGSCHYPRGAASSGALSPGEPGGQSGRKGRTSVMRVRILASGLVLLLAACSRGPAPAAPVPTAVAEPDTAPRDIRWAARPVPVPPSFQRAVDEGTRTLDGRPGPAYWQQRVAYRIDAELDPGTGRLQAEERVTYHNRSPDTLHVVVFNLYQNLFRAGALRNEPVPVTDGLVLERLAIAGAEARRIGLDAEAPPGRATYHLDGTLMVAHLPRPLVPGDSVEFQVAWHFTVPPADAPRTGRSDHAVYQVAQWYPQIAVYDDLRGWNADPYLGTGELYLEYGHFDVALTVPAGWLVAATGTLESPDEVLTDMARERLGVALRSDSVVQVVSQDDRDAGNATQRVPGGQLTWRFQARDVRDFAFAASDRYVWDA